MLYFPDIITFSNSNRTVKRYFKGKDVVLVSSSNYNIHTKNMLNAQILAEELAGRGVKVLFVESLGLKTVPLMGKTDWTKVLRRASDFLKLLFKGTYSPKRNIEVLSMVRLPFEQFPPIRIFNEWLIKLFVGRYSKVHLNESPILLLFLPTVSYLVDSLNPSKSVYYCVDDYSEVPFVNKKYVLEQERRTVSKVDLTISVSKNRSKYLRSIGKGQVEYLNNVARFDLFNKALTEKSSIPADMKKILKKKLPIAGFMGNIASYKEDLELLFELAKSSPDISFVLIGPIGSGEMVTDIEGLKGLENVYLLGPKDYTDLYRYFSFFDVGLIARKLNKANEGGFPLKYFEYLAAGLPVIVTDVKTLHDFSLISELGGIAKGAKDFRERILYWSKMKKENPKEWSKLLKFRVKVAKRNSWEERMKELDKLIG